MQEVQSLRIIQDSLKVCPQYAQLAHLFSYQMISKEVVDPLPLRQAVEYHLLRYMAQSLTPNHPVKVLGLEEVLIFGLLEMGMCVHYHPTQVLSN